jgi:ribonuclease Z
MSYLEQAYEFDIRIRLYDDRASPDGVVILAEDIGEGAVHEKGAVKITAFEVDHTPVKPAFGYRIDHAGRSVVLSGDTRLSDNLIRHAQGVDLLIHEGGVPSRGENIRNGAFFRLVKLTTNVPPARAAIGGTRRGQECQEAGWST